MNFTNQRTAMLCSIFVAAATIASSLHAHSAPKAWGFGNDEAQLKVARNSKSTVVRKALQIRDEIAAANYRDIKELCASIKKAVEASTLEQADVVEKTIQLLRSQRKVAERLREYAAKNPSIPFKVRFELKKICTRDTYQAAIDLLRQHGDTLLKGHLTFQPVQRTVVDLKFLLTYLLLALDERVSMTTIVEKSHLQLFFPVPVKNAAQLFPTAKLKDLKLFDPKASTFWIPNAGYVIAADPIDGQIRGTDCSGLVALTFDNPYHFSTKELAQLWQLKRKHLKSGQVSTQVNAEASCYEAADPATLQPGDLVVWRWKDNGIQRGHVVFFVSWARKPDTFISLEVAMLPAENLDGIGGRTLSLRRPNAELYILRRVKAIDSAD